MKNIWLAIGFSLIGMLIGGYAGWQKSQPVVDAPEASIELLELPDIEKNLRYGKEWLGKVVVVNHWATWCPPCRDEIPLLIEYQERLGPQGLQIVGVAHDLLDATRAFGDSIGINYPSLVAIVGGGEIMEQQGNTKGGVLPFTAFFNRQGKLVNTKVGKITEQELNDIVSPLL